MIRTNNTVLRSLRFTFDFSDSKMISIFELAEHAVSRAEVSNWLKKEDLAEFAELSDKELAIFLNGLINDKRGKQEGPQPVPEERLNNNGIFRKIKIAFDLKADDILEIMELVDFPLSKHELSAFFRKADHKHYKPCNDQILRNFLKGLQLKFRPDAPGA